MVPDPDRPGSLKRHGDFESSWQTPRQIGTDTDWATVSVTPGGGLALKRDGTLWGWGHDGRLGEAFDQYVPEPIRLDDATNWTSIAHGGSMTIANRDGEVWTLAGTGRRFLRCDVDTAWDELMQTGESLLGRNQQGEIWLLQAESCRWEGSTGRDMIFSGSLAWAINGAGQLLRWSTDPENAPRTASLPHADEFNRVGKRNDWLALDAGWGLARSVGLTADGGLWVWCGNYGPESHSSSYFSMPLSQRPRQVALLRTDTP